MIKLYLSKKPYAILETMNWKNLFTIVYIHFGNLLTTRDRRFFEINKHIPVSILKIQQMNI